MFVITVGLIMLVTYWICWLICYGQRLKSLIDSQEPRTYPWQTEGEGKFDVLDEEGFVLGWVKESPSPQGTWYWQEMPNRDYGVTTESLQIRDDACEVWWVTDRFTALRMIGDGVMVPAGDLANVEMQNTTEDNA